MTWPKARHSEIWQERADVSVPRRPRLYVSVPRRPRLSVSVPRHPSVVRAPAPVPAAVNNVPDHDIEAATRCVVRRSG